MAAMIDKRVYPTDPELESDEALNQLVKRWVGGDQYGKDYGAEGLRVVGASIMPECVRANINVTFLMIGERVAGLVKQGK